MSTLINRLERGEPLEPRHRIGLRREAGRALARRLRDAGLDDTAEVLEDAYHGERSVVA